VRSVDAFVRVGVKVAALPMGAATRRKAGDVTILCYHRVGAGGREIDVPKPQFEEQLAFLASGRDVRSLEGALSDRRGGVVLTFDDGFRDFHDVALPALVEHGLPAVLYLATAFVDAGDPRSSVPPSEALTWPMLAEAVSTGLVTVGSHTHGHVDLSRAGAEQSEEEMRRSIGLIEDRLGSACRHFAFPWGKASTAARSVARRRFASAALEAWRTNRAGRIDAHRLGRTPVFRSDGGVFFRAKTEGWLDGERLAYRALRRGPWAP
jgi:peptidoglycan/xylan/chitin deacetylase (PgdA/CDA1 family)